MLGRRFCLFLRFLLTVNPWCPDPRPLVPLSPPSTTRNLLFAHPFIHPKFIPFFCGLWRLRGTSPDFTTSFAFFSWHRVKLQGNSPRQLYFDTFLSQSRDLPNAPFARATLCHPARPGTLYGRAFLARRHCLVGPSSASSETPYMARLSSRGGTIQWGPFSCCPSPPTPDSPESPFTDGLSS